MKQFFLFSIFFSLTAYGRELIQLKTSDQQVIEGELISQYQDRWFWQKEGRNFLLLLKNGSEEFLLIPSDEVVEKKVISEQANRYQGLQQKYQTTFEGLPLMGRQRVLNGNEGYHKYEGMMGDFAWDLESLGPSGGSFQAEGQNMEDYFSWNQPIYSPVSGTVTYLDDSHPDNRPDPTFKMKLEGLSPNYMVIHIGGPFYLSLVHFRQNTIRPLFKEGQNVAKGQLLGFLGNSGPSYVPHLHMSLFVYVANVNRFISVPNQFKKYNVPQTGDEFTQNPHPNP